ncbi:MAG: dCTP deaminase [Actinomycetota bacterium]|nr:dCTP deaminase [Actinomycetota bacterium]
MDALADELRRQFTARLETVERFIEDLDGRFPPVAHRARLALRLYERYCKVASEAVESDWNHSVDAEDRIDLLRFHLRDLNDRVSELEDWFSGALNDVVPPSLVDAVERELEELLTAPRQVILSAGSADNYETLITELQDLVFGALGPHKPALEAELTEPRFALLRLPRLESREPSWRPVVLGHEVAHLALVERQTVDAFSLSGRLDAARSTTLSVPDHHANLRSNPALAIKKVGEEWIEELICDAYAVHRFGPAGVAALGGFFEFVGAFDEASDHPPGWLRCRLLAHWLGDVASPVVQSVIEPWRALAALPQPSLPDWATYLCELLWDARDDFLPLLADWPPKYEFTTRTNTIEWLAGELNEGVARADGIGAGVAIDTPITDADLINAGWVARRSPCGMPIDALVDKALESLDFTRRWVDAGGEVAPLPQPDTQGAATTSVLSESSIRQRLFTVDPQKRLVISPASLSAVRGASVDVRLGKHFIVFERSSTPAVSAAVGGVRRMQSTVEKSWDDHFVLHPGELVLASTLEYLVVPSDLAATVVTRSSYGRLGLITATAIFVHPWFKGSLTLELVNLGRVPLELQPGERIAQLSFHIVSPPIQQADPMDKYRCNTRPEFSRVGLDDEMTTLRKISRHHRSDD